MAITITNPTNGGLASLPQTFAGTANPNEWVQIWSSDGSTLLASAQANGSGDWSVELTSWFTETTAGGIEIVNTPTCTTRGTNGTSVTQNVDIPAGALVLAFAGAITNNTPTVSSTTLGGFTQRAYDEDTGASMIYSAVNSGGALTAEPITYNCGASVRPVLCVVVVTGGLTTALTNVYQGHTTGNSSTVSIPITPAAADSLVVGACFGSTDIMTSHTDNGVSTTVAYSNDVGDGNNFWVMRYTGLTPDTTQVTIGGTIAPAQQQQKVGIGIRPA